MDLFTNDSQLLDATQFSDISHVSGLESFVDLEEDTTMLEGDSALENTSMGNNSTHSINSSADVLPKKKNTSSSLNMFLQISTPPLSTTNSASFNESSMSLGKLEALQGNMQDSFLNSHSEDSDRDKRMQEYLSTNKHQTAEKKSSLTDIIESNNTDTKLTFNTSEKETPAREDKTLNQTELDSIFLREVRQKLQLSTTDNEISSATIDKTLQYYDVNELILNEQPSDDIRLVEQQLELEHRVYTSGDEDFDTSHINQVHRPNLDGNSSDSGDDAPSVSPATTFARTGLHTSRFEPHQVEEVNLRNNIPERQHAEGGAAEVQPYGDGGGGGDGSSGHSDNDMGGDGGVAIRTSSAPVLSIESPMNSDDDADRTAPLNREQPVGESTTIRTNLLQSTVSRQVQFALAPQSSIDSHSSQEHTPTGASLNTLLAVGDSNSDQSRLSARYFLAASTPFKSADNMLTASTSSTTNWMDQSSFHISAQPLHLKNESERTLVGEEVNTPSPSTLTRLRQVHGEPPDWTMLSLATANPFDDTDQLIRNNTTLTNTDFLHKNSQDKKNTVFNPFDSQSSESSFQAQLNQEFDKHGSMINDDFQITEKELDALLDQDEKIVAMNNNSVYKENNETGVSEWSVSSKVNQMSPRNDSKEDGRMSMYFKAKSNEMGRLSGDDGPRPKFNDESQQVVTPPTAEPFPLIRKTDTADKEQTIPLDAWNRTYKTFDPKISPISSDSYKQSSSTFNKSETPKSRLTATHKRNSETVFQKRQKRQLVGKERSNSEKSQDITKEKQSWSSASSHRKLTGQSKSPPSNRNSVKSNSSNQSSLKGDVSLHQDDIDQTINIPVTSAEADHLLASIREQQISMLGMTPDQVKNLAECIAKMTNTEYNLVFNLLKLLPVSGQQKQQPFSTSSVSIPSNSGGSIPMVPRNSSYPTTSRNAHSEGGGAIHKRKHLSDPTGRPISSVIPMNTESMRYNQFPDEHFTSVSNQNPSHDGHYTSVSNQNPSNDGHYTSVANQNPSNIQYLHSTGINNRHSDPQSMSVFYQPNNEYQRLAVSVSPVRQPYSTASNGNDFITPANAPFTNQNQFSNMNSDFHPLTRNQMPSASRSFVPLAQNNIPQSNTTRFHMTDEFGNYNKVSMHSDSINRNMRTISQSHFPSLANESITYPKNITLDAICVNTTATKVFKMYNSNSCWMQCQLKVVFLARNGIEFMNTSVLSIIPKVTIEPNSFEDVKLKFHTKEAGSYIFKIEVLTMPVLAEERTVEWLVAPSMINIDAVVEHPDVEVLLNSSKLIDFGELTYGHTRVHEMKILNKGRADVPLKISIANQQGDMFAHFQFQHDASINEVTNRQVKTLIAAGRKQAGLPMQPATVKLKFHAPNIQEKGKHLSEKSDVEIFSSQLEVESDSSPSFYIARILLNATVGMAKLHTLRAMQTISLSTVQGKQTSKMMPLQNAGNINLTMETKLVGSHKYLFTVAPAKLTLKPGEDREIEIMFKSDSSVEAESQLIVSVLPDGDQYKWNLHGSVSKQITVDSLTMVDSPTLLCNKLSLNWPGVAIGHSQLQKLVLRNNSDTQNIHLNMSISGDHSNFQIQNDFLSEQKAVNKYEEVIKPNGELPIHLLFLPSSFSMIKSSLNLRVTNGATKYIIPLTGYGGCSNLDINGAQRLNDQFWIDMGEVYLGKTNVVNIMLRNSGSRGAFVNIKCYSDITARIEYPATHVNITPNHFILLEKTSCQITLTYRPLQDDAIKAQEGTYTTAHLVIYSGDEVLRKEYKRYKQTCVSYKASSNTTLRSLCLEESYKNEDSVSDTCTYSNISDWESFFNASLSRTVMALVATSAEGEKQQKHTQEYFDKVETNDLGKVNINDLDRLQSHVIHKTPSQKLVKNEHSFKSCNSKLTDSLWSITPEQIIINTYENDSSGCKLLMVNYSNTTLPFEFIWPAQTLVITPSKEKIPPSSQLIVRVDAKPSFLSKEEIPWKGSLYIQCNGEQKCVQVQIRNDLVNDQQTPKFQPISEVLQPSHDLSLIPHQQEQDDVTIYPHILEFPNTNINSSKDALFTLKNTSSTVGRWILSSIAPPYFKNIDGKCEIVRATYSAFRFDKHSGKLAEREKFQLPVTFLPRSGGIYSQFWDFEVTYDGNQQSTKIRLELMGQGISSQQKHFSPNLPRKQVGTATPIVMIQKEENALNAVEPLKKAVTPLRRAVFVKEDVLEFPVTEVGSTTEMKYRVCNDTDEMQRVRVSGFRSPFCVIMKHMRLTVRAKSYIRVPVYFKPTVGGNKFEGLLILTPEIGETMCIKLVGRS